MMKNTMFLLSKKYKYVILLFVLQFSINYSQQYQCPYFPLEYGKTWRYTSNDYPDTLISSIVDTATMKGSFYYCFAPYGITPNAVRYWLRPDPKQIFALNMQDTTEYLLFDFKANVNDIWKIPPDTSRWRVPINLCDWGTEITLFSNSDTVVNTNRIFINCFLFGHFTYSLCNDMGIGNTRFVSDIGMIRFSQATEGGVLDWDIIVEKPETTYIEGAYAIVKNPCLTVPCIPGVVSAVKTQDATYILTENERLFWNGDFSWKEYRPDSGDSISVLGIITQRIDIYGMPYYTVEVLHCQKHLTTSVTGNYIKQNPFGTILYQNYPNPFNPKTTITYYLSEPSSVRISIYDINGREVKTFPVAHKNQGNHHVEINGEDLSSGIYYVQLVSNMNVQTKVMTLLK